MPNVSLVLFVAGRKFTVENDTLTTPYGENFTGTINYGILDGENPRITSKMPVPGLHIFVAKNGQFVFISSHRIECVLEK